MGTPDVRLSLRVSGLPANIRLIPGRLGRLLPTPSTELRSRIPSVEESDPTLDHFFFSMPAHSAAQSSPRAIATSRNAAMAGIRLWDSRREITP